MSTKAEVAIKMATDQVEKGKLAWIPGTGYRLEMKAICEGSGLGYSAAYTAIYYHFMPKAERLVVEGKPEPILCQMVQDARLQGQSWGYIAMRMQLPPGRVQKLWKLGTGLEAQGLRIGRGGRFLSTTAGTALYTGRDRKDLGSEIKAGQKANAKPTVKRTQKVAIARKAEAVTAA